MELDGVKGLSSLWMELLIIAAETLDEVYNILA
jgi:hypothetical protein